MRRFKLLIVCLTLAGTFGSVFSGYAMRGQIKVQTENNGYLTDDQFEEAKGAFTETETEETGLGPLFNGTSCAECHRSPSLGGASMIAEQRLGKIKDGMFAGGVLHSQAFDPNLLPKVNEKDIRKRLTLSVLGDGFVEAIADHTLLSIRDLQCRTTKNRVCGEASFVPITESPKFTQRIGRFGWKDQHASLVSFAGEAYFVEMGITNPFQSVRAFKQSCLPEPPEFEDDGEDVLLFARFMRATAAPSSDPLLSVSSGVREGEKLFEQIGCAVCHTPSITTAPVGSINPGIIYADGSSRVPYPLGGKLIHPYSDFLLHDIDTGDGIVQGGSLVSSKKFRTQPLWHLRFRKVFMHDGRSRTIPEAILAHGKEGKWSREAWKYKINDKQRMQLLEFLASR